MTKLIPCECWTEADLDGSFLPLLVLPAVRPLYPIAFVCLPSYILRLSGVYKADEEKQVGGEVWMSAYKATLKCHFSISQQRQVSGARRVLSSVIWVKCGILGGLTV